MTETSSFNCSTPTNETIVVLNQDIGYLLINYLKGLDAINFMETVNGSDQFGIIEITQEHSFYKIFIKISKEENIKVNIPYLHSYLDTCYINEEGYIYPENYHRGEAPSLRLFIHPTFTTEAFEKFCFTYKTPSFRCYSRLVSFNTYTYAGNLLLVDYFKYKDSIGCTRELNDHEQNLFKECLFFRSLEHNILNKQISFVRTSDEFMTNFESRFKSSAWIKAVDFNKFHISGGCIVNSLCKQPFSDTAIEQVDINFNGNSFNEFDDAVANVFANLMSILSKSAHHLGTKLMKKSNGSYNVLLFSNIQLQFNFKNVPDKTDPVCYILHSSDIDISQVEFTGSQILCTFAFLQAIATKSFICYTLHGDMNKSICNRIIRYCQRGFVFLEPQEFDNVLYIDIMASTILEEKREETKEIINDDGEIQTITITYAPRQWPLPNVDSHQLQETFIKRICSQKFG